MKVYNKWLFLWLLALLGALVCTGSAAGYTASTEMIDSDDSRIVYAGYTASTEMIDSDDSRIVYSGTGWEHAPDASRYMGSADIAWNEGDSASLTFNGTGVSLITEGWGWCSKADISVVDSSGSEVAGFEFDFKNKGGYQYEQMIVSGLPYGEYTVTVVKMAPSGDGSNRVVVDAFKVYGPMIVYSGNWEHAPDASRYMGSADIAWNEGDFVSLTFNGTGVSLITEGWGWCGTADISVVDSSGSEVAGFEFDFKNKGGYQYEQMIVSGLPYGEYTVTVERTGPSGVNDRIVIDAFKVHLTGEGLIDSDDPRIVYLGNWERVADGGSRYMGHVTLSWNQGDSASLTFNGTGVSLITEGWSWCGTADISVVDSCGSEVAGGLFDFKNKGGYQYEQMIVSGLFYGEYTVTVERTGPSGAGDRIVIDAFVVQADDSDAALLDACIEGRELVMATEGWDQPRNPGKGKGQGVLLNMPLIADVATHYVDSLDICNEADADELHSCIVSYFASGGKSSHFGE